MAHLKEYVASKASITNVSALMVLFALLTGARFSEVAGLTWEDLDIKNNTISINKTLDYKNDYNFLPTKTKGSTRVITIIPFLTQKLIEFHQQQLIAKITNTRQLMFLGRNGHVPSDNAVNKILRQAHRHLGIEQITFHGLRHTHASYLLYEGISIYVISHRLGHSDISITQRVYAHVILEMEQREENKITTVLEKV